MVRPTRPVWAVIPARIGSRRLPGKPLAEVAGLPLVEHVRRRCLAASRVDRVIVATDSTEVAAAVRGFGGEVVVTGPAPTGTHRVFLATRQHDLGCVVNVQGDMPLVDPRSVDTVVEAVWGGAEIATLQAPLPDGVDPDDPDVVKVLPGSRFSRGDEDHRPVRVHVGIYGFTPRGLAAAVAAPPDTDLEQRAWLAAGIRVRVVDVDAAPQSVDTADQLACLRARFEAGDLVLTFPCGDRPRIPRPGAVP